MGSAFGVESSTMLLYLLLLSVIGVQQQVLTQSLAPNNTYREVLDQATGLSLEWRVDRASQIISATIEADRAGGAIALALTRRGELEGADVIVCGIRGDGTPYINDMHGTGGGAVALDDNQDWELISGERSSSGRVTIRIQRALDSCDDKDTPIGSSLVDLVWSIGRSHRIPSRIQPQGTARIFFLDNFKLPQSHINQGEDNDARVWRLKRRYRMPRRHTSYWCSIQKLNPSLDRRHHVVCFRAFYEDEVSRRHVHHQILYRCTAPQGTDPATFFEPFLNHPGEECYLNANPQLPVPFCREMIYIDAVGAEPSKLPEVGMPIGESPNEYYLFEAHYDNQNLEEIEVESGIDLEYTPNLRENDGSIIFVGHGVLGTFIQPPSTSQYTVVGHCSKECTSSMLPSTGVEIIGTALHGHKSMQRMRLRHYRGGRELPTIMSDMQYDFNYQQLRMLETPIRVLLGDQLTMQCGYDNRWTNGNATVSGFSTQQEMCMGFLLLNSRLPYTFCSSELPADELLNRFGIHNVTWNIDLAERVIDSADNEDFVDLTLSQAIEQFTEWTPERVVELEGAQMFGRHRASCPNVRDMAAAAFHLFQGQGESGELIRTVDQDPNALDELPTVTLPVNVVEYREPTCPQRTNLKRASLARAANPRPKSQRVSARRDGIEWRNPSRSRSRPTADAQRQPTNPRTGSRQPMFRVRLNRFE